MSTNPGKLLSRRELGARFRKQRERRGISPAQAAAKVPILEAHLQAIESGQWDLLPGSVVCQELVRVYASYLDLNLGETEDAIATLCGVVSADETTDEESQGRKGRGKMILAVVVLTAGVGLLTWLGLQASGLIQPPSLLVSPTPTITPTPVPTATDTPAPSPTPLSTATATSAPPTATPTPECMEEYAVQSGDTLSGIALQFDVSQREIEAVNDLPDSNRLALGQVLCIPWPATPEP